jgi:[protein-PII] uridylyltransferase
VEIFAKMKATLEGLRATEVSYKAPWEILDRHTSIVDGLIQGLYKGLDKANEDPGMALVAVGGYGRKELSPWSDVDLMFLCKEGTSQNALEIVEGVLHSLWDLHMDVGHSVRTADDCLEVSFLDLRTWTALMDNRFVAGDRELFQNFQKRMWEDLFRAERDSFVRKLVQGLRERHRNFARSSFLVEPHLKEGPGGLRDIQSAMWLARSLLPAHELKELVGHTFISWEEAEAIQEAHNFLWRARLELHRLAGRKEDQLTFGMQERLSQSFSLGGDSSDRRAEAFMRNFYRHTTRIRYFAEDIIHKATDPSLASGPKGPTFAPEELGSEFMVVRGRITLLDEQAFESDPPQMMEAIAYAHRKGLDLDLYTRDQIKTSLHLVDGRFRKSKRVIKAFLSLLEGADCGYEGLKLIHRLGLLQLLIPEFGRICFQVQHDAYHAHTVDIHSLEAVGELARFRKAVTDDGKELAVQVAGEVKDWRGLALAVCLHDIGKGEGSGHAARGAKMVEEILRRWRLPHEELERVGVLVKEHLVMMDTALGRDLAEEKVIADLCRTVQSAERLNDLFLLTLSDLKATGPDLLTDWKNQLLKELYLKAKHMLETGDLVSPEASQKIQQARAMISKGLRDQIKGKELDKWVQSLPGRYLLTTPPKELADQVLMALKMVQAGDPVRVNHRSREGYVELIVCTRDAPGLFSKICGVLVAHGFNILGARIHTWTNGIVMDTFQVEHLGGDGSIYPKGLERLSRDLAAVLEEREDLDRLLYRRAPSPHMKRVRHPIMTPRIKIDNRSSDFYTIVEVRGSDRFGLLFALTRTMAKLAMDIHLALINTHQGQVFDVFYVLETTGQKVWDDDRLALLERALYQGLERMAEEN